MTNTCIFQDLGLITFKDAWEYQEKLFNETVNQKIQNRNPETINRQQNTKNYLLFCEHPHVYTLGKSGSVNNLLINDKFLEQIQATFYRINRGGDITYHGPGQLVGYPILDLDNFYTDVNRYLRELEECIILTIAEYGLAGKRIKGATGVWLDTDKPGKTRKICAMGVRMSRWVTMHGFALNINTDLTYFNHINPCGFTDKGATSLEKELGVQINMTEIKEKLKKHFSKIFNVKFEPEN